MRKTRRQGWDANEGNERRSKDRDLEGHRCATKDLRRCDSGNGFKEGQNKSRGPPPGGCATECEFEIRRGESRTENRESGDRVTNFDSRITEQGYGSQIDI